MNIFKNAELMRMKMPEYGYKFLQPKPEEPIYESEEELEPTHDSQLEEAATF